MTTNMMVIKDVLLSAKTGGGVITDLGKEIDLLATGAIALATSDDNVIVYADRVADLAGQPTIVFAVGGDTENDRWVVKVPRSADTYYKKQAYVAPVKEVQFLGNDGSSGSLNLPTLVAGDSASIRIIKKHPIINNTENKWRYEYIVQEGDVAADIVAALVALANADTSSDVTLADVSSVGFSFTADNNNETFDVYGDGVLADADKYKDGAGNSTAIVYGKGDNAQVLAMYESFLPNVGKSNKVHLPTYFFSQGDNLGTGNYDLYSIYWSNKRLRRGGIESVGQRELIIAVPTSPSTFVQAEFDTIMGLMFPDLSVVTN